MRRAGFQGVSLSFDERYGSRLDKMPDDFVIKKFLILNRAEVKNVFD